MILAQRHEKPRERLKRLGVTSLSDAELIALIITSGTKKSNVLTTASRVSYVLSQHREIPTLSQLNQLPGIGPARASQIIAAIEIGTRFCTPKAFSRTAKCMTSAKIIFSSYKKLFAHIFCEEFYALFLDTKLCVIACEKIFVGTLDSTVVHPREVFHRAIKHLAHSIVIFHNHPSGDPTPSHQDIEVTQTMSEVGLIVGIPIIDHIIFGNETFWSWNESNLKSSEHKSAKLFRET